MPNFGRKILNKNIYVKQNNFLILITQLRTIYFNEEKQKMGQKEDDEKEKK